MADEKKDSYTKLFNPILEALCKSNLNGSELKIVFYVIRCTYGWNKKKFAMSKSFIAEGTGIDRRNVGKIIKSLVERNVLIDYGVEKGSRTKIYGLNKHFSQWVMCGELTNGKSADICASNSALDSGNSADDMCGEFTAQNRHIKRHIKKEKEKKCSQEPYFLNPETGMWEEVEDEDGEDGGED
jgi:phage replication O-like protein O